MEIDFMDKSLKEILFTTLDNDDGDMELLIERNVDGALGKQMAVNIDAVIVIFPNLRMYVDPDGNDVDISKKW